LCPHRGCCNPSHMALTTNAENHAAGRTNFKSGPGRTPEQLASYRVARWEIPNAREDWAQHMRGRWRAMSPERRLEIGARISAGKRRSSQSSSVLL
jgi:hypothetical protein